MSLNQSLIYFHKGKAVEHYYLCHYRPKAVGSDGLSNSLLRFKRGLKYDLQAWIDCAVSELKKLSFPDEVVLMRALGSKEIWVGKQSNKALDQLGLSVAEAFGLNWMPHLISKSRHTRPLKYLARSERISELKNAFSLSTDYFDLTNKRILLLDDIVTTGTTVRSIICLIKQYFPNCRFKVFTLAKSNYVSLNSFINLEGNSYTWQPDEGWVTAEGEENYNSYVELKESILRDDFSNL